MHLIKIMILFVCVGLMSCNISVKDSTESQEIPLNIELLQTDDDVHFLISGQLNYDSLGYPPDSLKLLVNGKSFDWISEAGGFLNYGKPSRFEATLPLEKHYIFQIKQPNGKIFYIGEIDALEKEQKNPKIYCPKKGNLKEDLVVSWEDLVGFNQLDVKMTYLANDPSKTLIAANDTIISIPKTGKYVFPKSKFKTKEGTITDINFTFYASKIGKKNPKVVRGENQLKIYTLGIDRNVSFNENE